MGMDAGCDLSFGVHVKGEDGWPAHTPFNWSKQQGSEELLEGEEDLTLGEYLALKSGLADPYEVASADPNYDDYDGWAEGTKPEGFDESTTHWYAEQRRLESEAPIEIVFDGSSEGERSVMVVLKQYHHSGSWEAPTDLGAVIVSPLIDDIVLAERFCKANDIYPFANPTWLLSANYG